MIFGPFWASVAKIRGTPKMKNGALNILICLLDPIKSIGTAGSDDEKRTPQHHCSLTRSVDCVSRDVDENYTQLDNIFDADRSQSTAQR